MLTIELRLSDNPLGADPLVGLYRAINRSHPSLKLTQVNSEVLDIRPYAREDNPQLTRLQVRRKSDQVVYEFFYSRIDINKYISNPFWSAADMAKVNLITNSTDLVKYIGRKVNLNISYSTHWTNDSYIEYTGGSTKPNFHLRSTYNNVYFTGDVIVHLFR